MCIPGTRRGCQRHNNARLLFDFLTMNLKRYRSIQLVVINGVFTKGSQAQIINAKAVSGTRSLFHLGFTKANAAREFQMGLFTDSGIRPSLAFFIWQRICRTQMYEHVRVAHKSGQKRVIVSAPEFGFNDGIKAIRGNSGQLLQFKRKKKRPAILPSNTEANTTYRLATLRTILLGP